MRSFFRNIIWIVLISAAAWLVLRNTSLGDSFKNFFKAQTITVDKSPIVLQEVKSLAQLMTMEMRTEVVADTSRSVFGMRSNPFRRIPGNPLGFIPEDKLVLIVKGQLLAGIDIQNLDSNAIRHNGDSIFVQLPRATVQDVIINPGDVEVFIEKGTWNTAAMQALQQEAKYKIQSQAIAAGVLQQADAQARNTIADFLKSAGFKYVLVTSVTQVKPGLQ